jgi:HEAT repeat protein
MRIYCTECWQENSAASRVCSRCGVRLEGDNWTFVAKLIRALFHPEPMTVQRAAWILGELKAQEAIDPMITLVQTSQDLGTLESAVEALGKIGDEKAVEALSRLISTSYLTVRLQVVKALVRIGGNQACAVLQQALHDSSSSVAQEARKTLVAMETEQQTSKKINFEQLDKEVLEEKAWERKR